MSSPAIIAVGGFASDVGKTTLMCALLPAFPGWEAIKTTRGHYRSCGKDPLTCCVSHLLGDEPLVLSGREKTYEANKDTGRYWDAGAKNVHWMIAADEQVETGIRQVLERVSSEGVLIEGNSFTQFVEVSYLIMVARRSALKIKGSARSALSRASALYLTDEPEDVLGFEDFYDPFRRAGLDGLIRDLPIYTPATLPQLVAEMRRVMSPIAV